MSGKLGWILLFLFACFVVGQVHAGIRPSFDLSRSAWKATHIVIIDARGVVKESWKGDLLKGAALPIEEFKLPLKADVHYDVFEVPHLGELPKNAVKQVTGERRILFLIRDNHEPDRWRPADLFEKDMATSAIWLEKDRAYAIQQWINPGPAEMP